MAVESLEKTKEEITEILKKAEEVSEESDSMLSNIFIKIPSTSTKVIQAIVYVFGKSYIKADGSSIITYEMFKNVNQTLRKAGKVKVGEYV